VHFRKVIIVIWQFKGIFAAEAFDTNWNLERLYC
jgi:hypothetical protein